MTAQARIDKESVNDMLRRVYEINRNDAERLISHARQHGDTELLARAEADLATWKIKLENLAKPE